MTLVRLWKKYVDTDIYRVTSAEYMNEIKERGIDPSRDPFAGKYAEIERLFGIMLRLQREGEEYVEEWRDGPAKASDIVEFNKESRENNYIDFVPDYQQAMKFYNKWKGGALTNVVYNFTSWLLDKRLGEEEMRLVEKLHAWSSEKRKHKNRIIAVKGSDRVFEKAKMLLLPKGERKIVESPYGPLEHFKRIVEGKMELYLPYLKKEELSYLRVEEKISPEAIKVII